ncbi:hypothetical protein HLRTI_003140 [Halorhabdus tiamatea SARL4B]|uniref:Uncharacterized protein n=1 Tax=Halorhabdus tiamatea SARL4B TaxID=1033806 RepID=U2F8P8_9EURY|nr:hypothetical protein HLRTI_003140 [Halorhabdus tiamatea SARL4B]
MALPFRERFWKTVCSAERTFLFLFIFTFTLVVVALITMPALEPGTGAWVVMQFDLAIFGVLLVFVSLILWTCRSRRKRSNSKSEGDSKQ